MNTTEQTTTGAAIDGNTIVGGIPNRTIKFRFWLGHTNKMTYSHFLNEVGTIIPFFSKDIVTLQFTGLIDCEGEEIYEGDIVKWGHLKDSSECWHRYAVVQINPDLQLKIIYYKVAKTQEQKQTDNHIFHWGRFAYGEKDLEKIGNVFQNPELLG